ncbi:MAG TPA: 3-isopropylmalate dehydratase small subunit [Acidimicrobiia bacterium]|nr:3-isopropylmalate dehydratase small subunit [Acidimicrobiia bacterium]
MNPVNEIIGTIAPLPRANIDTDQIMPKQYLKRVERTGYGQFCFAEWRADAKFVLQRPEYQNAKILVTGPNFGSGSSREHAPWGLQDWGFEAVIAPSFADIFFTNCTKIGLLPVVLTEKECQYLIELAEADPTAEITVSVPDQTVAYREQFEARFELDPFVKWRFVEGLDDIGLTLRHADDIDEFEARRPAWKPALT